jgi:hypothetical protein
MIPLLDEEVAYEVLRRLGETRGDFTAAAKMEDYETRKPSLAKAYNEALAAGDQEQAALLIAGTCVFCYTIVLPFFSCLLMSLSVSLLTLSACLLLAFDVPTWHESNHHLALSLDQSSMIAEFNSLATLRYDPSNPDEDAYSVDAEGKATEASFDIEEWYWEQRKRVYAIIA